MESFGILSGKNLQMVLMKTYRIGEIEVLGFDLKPQSSWVKARNSCWDLGEGWRLPDIEELGYLFELYSLGVLGLSVIRGEENLSYRSNSINGNPNTSNDFDCEVFYFKSIYSDAGDGDIVWELGNGQLYHKVRPIRNIK